MKVSVIIPAYKFSDYISECLDSVLNQKPSFDFEILIRDDFSKDGTEEIILEYSKNYPNIKVLNSFKNIGFHENARTLLSNCSGEYISYLDGDDYWIDPNKLQIQSDFLDNNSEYSMVFAGYKTVSNKDSLDLNNPTWIGVPDSLLGRDIETEDLIHGNPIGSLTRMFRNYGMIFKDYMYDMSVNDWALNYEISKKGKIKYLDIPVAVYRVHSKGLSSNLQKGVSEYENNRKIIEKDYGKWNL